LNVTEPTTSQADRLADKRYVTLILRLRIDPRERLVHGEVVDTEGKSQGRFAGWRELNRMVRNYLMSH
jgi:hypothetical protein